MRERRSGAAAMSLRCGWCGAESADAAAACPACGQPLTAPSPPAPEPVPAFPGGRVCPVCGSTIRPGGSICPVCRSQIGFVSGSVPAGRPGVAEQIIPARNAHALIGYYLSVASLIPCLALVLGPAAILFGARGLQAIGRDPVLPGKAHCWVAIILGSLTSLLNWGLVLVLVISILTSSPR